MNTTAAVRTALSSPEGVRAVASGDHGTVIRLVRVKLGIPQTVLAAQIGRSQSAVSRLEKGSTADAHALARAIGPKLGIPPEALGFVDYGNPDAGRSAEQEVDVKRSEMIRGMLGVAAMLAFPAVLTAEAPRRIGAADVEECAALLGRLDTIDTRIGGEAVYEISADLMRRLRGLVRTTACTDDVAHQLHRVLATGYETAGWLAYDTGKYDAARAHWLEGLHLAEVHGLHTIRVTVMADMALHATNAGWGGDAVELARAAARSPVLTPRVASLLAAREGLGYAISRDPGAANDAFVRSARLLDKGSHPDDPPWVDFWGPDDFACHQSKAAMLLRDYATAERASRTALAGARSGPWARNQALYGVRVGNVLTRRRNLDEAIAVLRPIAAAPIGSGRVRAELLDAAHRIGQHTDYRPAREFARWAARMVAA